MDKYLVTVGRFRQFVAAYNAGTWTNVVTQGSGKHTHLNGGLGLANSGSAGTYEPGWNTSDNANVSPKITNLRSCSDSTWTASGESNENLPITCVNWWEAYAFCIWDGGFLPSEAEWEYVAAGGSDQREYPWGSAAPGTVCPGTGCSLAIYGCYYPNGSGSCSNVSNIAPVGYASQGAGKWGQLDMAGEVFEWNLDYYYGTIYGGYINPCTDCAYLTSAFSRVFRGGIYAASPVLLPPRRDYTAPSGNSGFRCSRTP